MHNYVYGSYHKREREKKRDISFGNFRGIFEFVMVNITMQGLAIHSLVSSIYNPVLNELQFMHL